MHSFAIYVIPLKRNNHKNHKNAREMSRNVFVFFCTLCDQRFNGHFLGWLDDWIRWTSLFQKPKHYTKVLLVCDWFIWVQLILNQSAIYSNHSARSNTPIDRSNWNSRSSKQCHYLYLFHRKMCEEKMEELQFWTFFGKFGQFCNSI